MKKRKIKTNPAYRMPKPVYLNGDDRIIYLGGKPTVMFTPEVLRKLIDNSVMVNGNYITHLVSIDIVDGLARLNFEKDVSE